MSEPEIKGKDIVGVKYTHGMYSGNIVVYVQSKVTGEVYEYVLEEGMLTKILMNFTFTELRLPRQKYSRLILKENK